jgi:hypothetical protein
MPLISVEKIADGDPQPLAAGASTPLEGIRALEWGMSLPAPRSAGVLDSVPGTGHGEFNPLCHVFLIQPIPGMEAAHAARLPVKSEAAVDKLITDCLATETDLHFYFLCLL